MRHRANSAAIFDLSGSYFDAVRPGIALYGLRPSCEISHPRVYAPKLVLELKMRISHRVPHMDADMALMS